MTNDTIDDVTRTLDMPLVLLSIGYLSFLITEEFPARTVSQAYPDDNT